MAAPAMIQERRGGMEQFKMALRTITVFGGSGFIGRHVVRRLASTGIRVRVATRDPEGSLFLRTMGDVGQIAPILANIRDQRSVEAAIARADAVVNLVGSLNERGRQTFAEVHANGATRVAAAATAAGVSRLIHMSAIGADRLAMAAYARSKAAGEAGVRRAFERVTILRPSVVFGLEDDFFNRFAALARLSPVLPLFGGGETCFQPVYVGDVAAAVVRSLDDPASAGRTYELGGPRVYTFQELMELILAATGRRRQLVPIPFGPGRILAALCELIPNPPITRDQLRMLESDNVAAADALTLTDLGVTPTAAEGVVLTYLDRYRRAGTAASRQPV